MKSKDVEFSDNSKLTTKEINYIKSIMGTLMNETQYKELKEGELLELHLKSKFPGQPVGEMAGHYNKVGKYTGISTKVLASSGIKDTGINNHAQWNTFLDRRRKTGAEMTFKLTMKGGKYILGLKDDYRGRYIYRNRVKLEDLLKYEAPLMLTKDTLYSTDLVVGSSKKGGDDGKVHKAEWNILLDHKNLTEKERAQNARTIEHRKKAALNKFAGAIAGGLIGTYVGDKLSNFASKQLQARYKELVLKKPLTGEELIEKDNLRLKIDAIKAGSLIAFGFGGLILGKEIGKRSTNYSHSNVRVTRPSKNFLNIAIDKDYAYNKLWKKNRPNPNDLISATKVVVTPDAKPAPESPGEVRTTFPMMKTHTKAKILEMTRERFNFLKSSGKDPIIDPIKPIDRQLEDKDKSKVFSDEDKSLKPSAEFLSLAEDKEYAFKLGQLKTWKAPKIVSTAKVTSKTTGKPPVKAAPKEVGSISTYVINVAAGKSGSSSSSSSKKSSKPQGSTSLLKMRKWKRVLVYYKAKKDVAASGFMVNWTPADEMMMKRAESRYRRSRALAAPELMKALMLKRAARGRGKKRGSQLAKLSAPKVN